MLKLIWVRRIVVAHAGLWHGLANHTITRYLSPLRGETFLCAGTHGEPMTNKSMVRINQDRGSNDPALPKPNPVSPTPVPATESDPELDTTEDPPDSPQVQPKRP